MARDIRFRAWDGKILYYNPYIPNHGTWAMLDETIKDCQDNYIALTQYTGLKDKNGIEIYEGDIVKIDENRFCQVIWHDYHGGWDLEYIKETATVQGFKPCRVNNVKTRGEVIGNIHQNPEKLK